MFKIVTVLMALVLSAILQTTAFPFEGLRYSARNSILEKRTMFDVLRMDETEYEPVPYSVSIPYGTIQGKPSEDGKVISFLGIPFAAPPVGANRFRKPQPVQHISVESIFDATQMGNICIQDPSETSDHAPNQSEDCLNLNVYTPARMLGNSGRKLPVLVFIYGGSFTSGKNSNPLFNGASFLQVVAQERQTVIVVPNYRVGVFGFLSSMELMREGSLNAGLMDQAAAFGWVKQNIEAFGGDSSLITAWGQSAGAISIATHLMQYGGKNPDNTPFDRMILQSGGLPPVLNTPYQGQNDFDKVALSVNCPKTSAVPVMDCLRSVDASTLFKESFKLQLIYRPSVDGTYITEQPYKAVVGQRLDRVPAIMLGNTDEGTYFAIKAGVDSPEAARKFMHKSLDFLKLPMYEQLDALYPVDGPISPVFRGGAPYGDGIFNCPSRQISQFLSNQGDDAEVYKGRFNVKPSLLPPGKDALKNAGVYHGAELAYTWNYSPLLDPHNGDRAISLGLITAFTDFAHGKVPRLLDTGLPSNQLPTAWPIYKQSDQLQVVWQHESPLTLETITEDMKQKCKFWDHIFTTISKVLT
ncbi:hypothetical protein O5D80_001421 [Batrachochytrium dendrobatidis]|nr:hypothetical protein O5D80_001421 [Batrachochytrium dendrobatidis]